MTFYTDDYGMTAEQLEAKYDPSGSEDDAHPGYTVWDYVQVVAQRSTRLGYWEWVRSKLEEEQDELDRDNPHNQWMYES